MTISIIAKNASQAGQTIVRGGRLTVLGSGGHTELPINQGGLLTYNVPAFKTALIRGSMVVTNLGSTNTFIQVEMFDTQSGRLIPIARANAVNVTVNFEMKLVQLRNFPVDPQDQQIEIHGDGANDGVAEWFAFIEEKPN